MICNRDCFNCSYPDCINDETNDAEVIASDALDQIAVLLRGIDAIAAERHKKAARERYYQKRDEILEKQREYNREHPEKRRETNQKYYNKIKARKHRKRRKKQNSVLEDGNTKAVKDGN